MTIRKLLIAVSVLSLGLAISGELSPPKAAPFIKLSDIKGESLKSSQDEIERLGHEMGHILQQRQGQTAVTARMDGKDRSRSVDQNESLSVRSSRTSTGSQQGKSSTWMRVSQVHARQDAARLASLSDRILAETRKLERLYQEDPQLKEGLKRVRPIEAEARRIRKLSRELGNSPTPQQTHDYYTRVSERLRHQSRAHDGHKAWINLLSVSSPIHKPGGGSTDDQAAGDPDKPVITGRIYNPGGDADDRPTEEVAFYYDKISLSTARVRNIYRYRGRLHFMGSDKRLYALPDGIYSSGAGNKINIRGRVVTVTGSGNVIVKGSKIKENFAAGSAQSSSPAPGDRAAAQRRLMPVRIASRLTDGRFQGSSGAWFEVKGGSIVALGGQVERHRPPPFLDVDSDGGLKATHSEKGKKKGNVDYTWKIEEGE